MTKGTRLPEGWQPRDVDILRIQQQFPAFDDEALRAELENFRDYWTAKSRDATKMDWNATYRMWMRKAGPTVKPKHSPFQPSPKSHIPEQDHILYLANRMLARHMMSRHGLPAQELEAILKVKRDIITWFTQPILEGDEMATPKAFVTQFAQALGKVSPLTQDTRRAWGALIREPAAESPFAPSMARAL
jgi:hypothetical protein